MRYFIHLSYLGTNYHGWQSQENAIGIQQVLEEKLSVMLREKIEVIASGRTDTGVHAFHQVVHMDSEQELDEDFMFRMNCILPRDIALQYIRKVTSDAHARFDAISREYEYYISRTKNPFLQGKAWQYTRVLDINSMNEAAAVIERYTGFQCFSKIHTDVKTFNCTVDKACWEERSDNMLVFTIRANRFLRGMVRAIVGTLVEVGQGKRTKADFEQIILSGDRGNAGAAAPPEGLFLKRISYPEKLYIDSGDVMAI